jgi:acetylornithine deacetylase/succinyl-diaminopimelate desuccinylase-like protein
VVLPPPLTGAIMRPIEEVTHRIYPGIEVVPVLQAAGTDAIYLAESGIPTYGLSGMFIDPDLSNIHGRNERIRVQSLYDGRDFLHALVKAYAAGEITSARRAAPLPRAAAGSDPPPASIPSAR